MTATQFDIEVVTSYYRILGLPLRATREDIRRSRNRLIMKFHPDRHTKGWIADEMSLADRVRLVQEAYQYLVDHYDEIAKELKILEESVLSSHVPDAIRSHWIYAEVSKIKG